MALGWRDADPIVGLVITIAILGVLRSAIRQVGARLLDAVDPALVDQAHPAAVTSVPGIPEVREIHVRWIGHTLRAELDATVGPSLTVTEADGLAHDAERHLLDQVADSPPSPSTRARAERMPTSRPDESAPCRITAAELECRCTTIQLML